MLWNFCWTRLIHGLQSTELVFGRLELEAGVECCERKTLFSRLELEECEKKIL